MKSGLTQTARLAGSDQGVVVQARSETDGSSTRGKERVTSGRWKDISFTTGEEKKKVQRRTSRVMDVPVFQPRFEVTQRSGAPSGVRHNPQSLVNQVLLKQLSKDPPDTFHVGSVERLVIVVKVDPPSQPLHRLPPLGRVSHDNGTTFFVVLVDTQSENVGFRSDVELFVDLVFDGETVGVPTETAFDVEAVGVSKSCDDIL